MTIANKWLAAWITSGASQSDSIQLKLLGLSRPNRRISHVGIAGMNFFSNGYEIVKDMGLEEKQFDTRNEVLGT